MSNLTLSEELFDAQIELREERRKQQEEYEQYRADIEGMKRKIEEIEATALHSVLHLQGVIEEKDNIIQILLLIMRQECIFMLIFLVKV
ncbi:hypothetical protein F8M41_023056 [Gigaspora margarita]|uniref:Uncharacterized protein n=1 Tax=Gigaspora margarita TaxID=4874 RepID=A0A8H4AE09_GIGMA|nr:hypothetical protein F8M41_023056 [Gigaspora margarita]